MWWPCCAALLCCPLALLLRSRLHFSATRSILSDFAYASSAWFGFDLRLGLNLCICAPGRLPKPNNMCLVFENLFEFTLAQCIWFRQFYLKPKLVNFTRNRCCKPMPIYFMFVLFWVKVSGAFVLPPLFPPRTYTLFR